MKELSLFLLKNSFGAKMRKGFRNFCNGDGSTSTLNQQRSCTDQYFVGSSFTPMATESPYNLSDEAPRESRLPTLEEMILQIELEEKMGRAAKAKLDDEDDDDNNAALHHRMSCVNSSDILRTARNALNQYPRFSLDGKDAMYRSSFRNLASAMGGRGRKSVYCNHHLFRKGRLCEEDTAAEEFKRCFPAQVAGETVVWCKPGVVAKLMGLEAVPIPINGYYRSINSNIKKKHVFRRSQRHEMERRRHFGTSDASTSHSSNGYCILKPVEMELANEDHGWPMQRRL